MDRLGLFLVLTHGEAVPILVRPFRPARAHDGGMRVLAVLAVRRQAGSSCRAQRPVGLICHRTVGRPPSPARAGSARSQPRSASIASVWRTTRGSVRPVQALRYTSRAVKGVGNRPRATLPARRAAATRAGSVTLA